MPIVLIYNTIKKAAFQWLEDNPFQLAAALAYYTLFSMAPLLTVVIAIAAVVVGADAAQSQIVGSLSELVGTESAEAVQATLRAANKEEQSGPLATVIGVVVLLVGASMVVAQLQHSLNHIWGVETDVNSSWFDLIRQRLFSFAFILGVGFLLMVSLLVSSALSAVTAHFAGAKSSWGLFWQVVDTSISVCFLTVLFGLIYKLLPDVRIGWGDVVVGAAVTAIFFTIGKFAIAAYVGYAGLGSVYGAAGSLVTVLAWVYYSSLIFFFGAEVTQVYASQFGRGVIPTTIARPSRDAHVAERLPQNRERRVRRGRS